MSFRLLGGDMNFRGACGESETTFVKKTRKIINKCSLRFYGRPSEQVKPYAKTIGTMHEGPATEMAGADGWVNRVIE